jgi:cell division protein FtsB
MKRLLTFFVLGAILLVVLTQIYLITKEREELKAELSGLSSRLEALNEENGFLMSEINYFSNPENLEKELRSKLNYKSPGEEMMIIVP